MKSSPPVYKDLWFRIIGCLVISEIIDSIGREESFFQRLDSKYFYTDLLGGFVIAFLLWEISRFMILRLDRRFDWMERPLKRSLLQLVLGVGIPSLLSFLLTLVYMKFAYNQDIFQTSWLYNEFYTVILFIVFINLVYFTWWILLKWKEQQLSFQAQQSTGRASTPTFPAVLEVSKAGKTVLLPAVDMAFAYLANGYCYIKTFEEDTFVTTYTLDEVVRMLDESAFFRANRQTLVSRRSITGYKSIENGKIELDLHPTLKSPVIVSQKRASDFRKWVAVGP